MKSQIEFNNCIVLFNFSENKTFCVMLCCKGRNSLVGSQMEKMDFNKCFQKIHQMEEIVQNSSFSSLDVLEWTMELRENNMMLDLHNIKVKEKKIKDIEESEASRVKAREQEIERREREVEDQRRKLEEERKQMEERHKRQREFEEREEVLNLRHQEILDRQRGLKEKDAEIKERSAILEITLKLNEKEERIAIQLSNLQSATSEEQLNILRRREIEEREREVAQQQTNLEARELQLEEKNTILKIAIRLNEFR
jgi:hypothetical protein